MIQNVAAHDSAQPLHVEKCVLDFQRIERPFDQIDAARWSASWRCASFSLRPTPAFAILGQHAQHVAVQIVFPARLQARNREAETDHSIAVVSAESVAADLRRHHEQAHREQFDILESPDFLLQTHRLHKLARA